jgi:hypothetical protein
MIYVSFYIPKDIIKLVVTQRIILRKEKIKIIDEKLPQF